MPKLDGIQIKAFSEYEFHTEAEVALRQIFVQDDPYGRPFALHVPVRLIVYDFVYELESPMLEAVNAYSKKHGETGFYVTILDRPEAKDQAQPYHWYVPFSDAVSYGSLVGPLQNAVYSPGGHWGIMASDENHALLGGALDLVETIREFIPELDSQVYGFLDLWRYYRSHYGSKVDWLPGLLENVYGRETAERMLKENGFDDLTPYLKTFV